MPNWVDNRVEVKGTKKDLFEFQEFVKGEPFEDYGEAKVNWFCLNTIMPMPWELKDTVSPSRIVSDDEYLDIMRERKKDTLGIGHPITASMQKSFIDRFGTDNWYDWCVRNWGTKWNIVYTSDFEEIPIDDMFSEEQSELSYSFDTAWSPPEPIYRYLQDKFGSLDIDWEYVDEGWNFAGSLNRGVYIEQPSIDTKEQLEKWKKVVYNSEVFSMSTEDLDEEFDWLEEHIEENV